jgi:hypothetical protein
MDEDDDDEFSDDIEEEQSDGHATPRGSDPTPPPSPVDLPEGDASARTAAGVSEQSESLANTRKASEDAAPDTVKRRCVPVQAPQFAPSDLGGPLSRTLSLPGLGAGLGRDMLA